jgi:hypothetical protein
VATDRENISELRAEIAHAARLPDLAERSLEVVAVVDALAAPFGITPVIVGGMAVYFWTATDEFTTYDIDVVMEVPDELARKLDEVGFVRTPDRRHWTLEGTEVMLEAPGSQVDSEAVVTDIKLHSGRTARIISRVDILIDRLDEFQATGHETPAQQSLALLKGLSTDESAELDDRAPARRITAVLNAMRQLADELEAGRTPPDTSELHELANTTLRTEYHPQTP